ncbi:MAG: hypothetical protein H0U23_17170 [Blastocatellia bacterium]|nr:hypothetical protein [Blastocatellia bacterium]
MTSIIGYNEKVAAIRRYLALKDKRRLSFTHPEDALLQVRLPMPAEDCSFTLDSEELHNLMSDFSETEAVRDLFADFL